MAAAESGGLIYFFGGYQSTFPQGYIKSTLAYSLQTGSVTHLPDMPIPMGISRVVFLNGHFYIFGSQLENCLDYNVTTKQWVTFPPPSTGGPEVIDALAVGNSLFALTANALYKITPYQTDWTSVVRPGGKFILASFSDTEFLLISSDPASGTVLRFNSFNGQFTTEATLPNPAGAFVSPLSARIGSELFVFNYDSRQVTLAPISSFRQLLFKN